jgi:hypothetical protein
MGTLRIDSHRRGSRDRSQCAAREPRLPRDSGGDEIAGRSAWNEHHEPIAAADAVTPCGDGLDLKRNHFGHQPALI